MYIPSLQSVVVAGLSLAGSVQKCKSLSLVLMLLRCGVSDVTNSKDCLIWRRA